MCPTIIPVLGDSFNPEPILGFLYETTFILSYTTLMCTIDMGPIISQLKLNGEFFENIFDRWNLKFEFENMTVRKSEK